MSRIIFALASLAITVLEFGLAQNALLDTSTFSAKLFSEVIRTKPNTSVITSSYSILEPLGQLALGAQGSTATELLAALGIRDVQTLKDVVAGEKGRLGNAQGIELKLANKIFVNNKLELSPDYKLSMQRVFLAEPQYIDVSDPKTAVNTVNSWVESHTNQHIKDMMEPNSIKAETSLLLVNAAYFKGEWVQKFDPLSTKQEKFYGPNKTVDLPMMHQTAIFQFGFNDAIGAKFLELPYKGNDASLLIVLPYENSNLEAFVKRLQDGNFLEKQIEAMFPASVTVTLPKFSIQTETNLKEVLPKLGVTEIFNVSAANLTTILPNRRVFVTEAKQKAFIDINEDGSVVAVSNAFEIILAASPSATRSAVFTADHPFAFFLRIKNTTLFEGIYAA